MSQYTKYPVAGGGAGTVTAVTASGPLTSSGGTTPNISLTPGSISTSTTGVSVGNGANSTVGPAVTLNIQTASGTQPGLLSSSDWNTFNNKMDKSRGNYITNPDAEVNTAGWNLYNNAGRAVPAFVVAQDITYTAVAAGNAGNGINIDYIFHPTQSYLTPLVTVVSPTHITVAWYNGPTLANNPTATQLKAAFDAVPGAVALATAAITGTAGNRQYETGSNILAQGGDTAPINGTGGVPSGVTFTRNTSTPLVGIASFDLGKDANSEQGQGVSTDFVINSIDKNALLQISFAYSGSAAMALGSASDIQVFVYDTTNNVMLPVTPTTIPGPVSTAKTFVGTFTATSSSTYRLILHIATVNASAWDLLLDAVLVSDVISPGATTSAPQIRLSAQPVSAGVNNNNGPMAVGWPDGGTQWVPLTSAYNGDYWALMGFAVNVSGATADIVTAGALSGFSFGPFVGYNQYVDTVTPGTLNPLPSPFTDTYLIAGKAISSTTLLIQFYKGIDLIVVGGVPRKGGLLTNNGANTGGGDSVLVPGANNSVLVANSAAALGLNYVTTLTGINTTGSAATLTTARTIAGTSFNGAANITLANKFIVQGTADAGLSGPQFLGALATGLVKNTTTTGVLSIATAADVTGALLTGYVSGAGTVAATDSILQAFNKLNGNDALKAPLATPTFTGNVNSSTGDVLISTIGKGLQVKTGANAKIGTAVLVGGTVTVANTSVTANSRIFLTSQADGGTVGFLRITAKTAATSFVITSSSALDTSTVAWVIIESIP